MPVLMFTEGDKLAGKVMEKGGYKARMTEISQKASTSAKSVNFFTTFTITQEGKYMGKELNPIFNTESSSSSVLGSAQFFPHRDLLKVKAAVEKVPFDSVGLNLDTDDLLNKDIDIMVDVVPNKESGELMNIITAFLPAGSSGGMPPF